MIYKCPEGHPTVIGFILKNVSKFTAIGHGIFIFHEKIFQNCSFICAHCSPLTALGSHNSNPRLVYNQEKLQVSITRDRGAGNPSELRISTTLIANNLPQRETQTTISRVIKQ